MSRCSLYHATRPSVWLAGVDNMRSSFYPLGANLISLFQGLGAGGLSSRQEKMIIFLQIVVNLGSARPDKTPPHCFSRAKIFCFRKRRKRGDSRICPVGREQSWRRKRPKTGQHSAQKEYTHTCTHTHTHTHTHSDTCCTKRYLHRHACATVWHKQTGRQTDRQTDRQTHTHTHTHTHTCARNPTENTFACCKHHGRI